MDRKIILGILGLASFSAEQRTREIGIRKVAGSSVGHILLLITHEFSVLILVSNLIAWPVAYFALNDWLRNYAYHAALTATPFLASTALALIIALLTVGYQALNAARANPVDSLRYE